MQIVIAAMSANNIAIGAWQLENLMARYWSLTARLPAQGSIKTICAL
jgi:hypothetical protein